MATEPFFRRFTAYRPSGEELAAASDILLALTPLEFYAALNSDREAPLAQTSCGEALGDTVGNRAWDVVLRVRCPQLDPGYVRIVPGYSTLAAPNALISASAEAPLTLVPDLVIVVDGQCASTNALPTDLATTASEASIEFKDYLIVQASSLSTSVSSTTAKRFSAGET